MALIVTSAIALFGIGFGAYQYFARKDEESDQKMVEDELEKFSTKLQVDELNGKVDELIVTSVKFEGALTDHAKEEARIFGETNVKLAQLAGLYKGMEGRMGRVETDIGWIKGRMNGGGHD